MSIRDVIEHRRDGIAHDLSEVEELVRGCADGSVPDYQLAAWLMAAYLHPLSPEETAWLTLAMAHSGHTVDRRRLPKPWIDKHSTGGVGDKTSLVLLPVLAACGLTLAKMSGRGLGITGGTIDKLSSIPGFRTDLTPEEMVDQAIRVGIAMTGQTPELAPADRTLYALRDATATVGSLPLMVSSILCKKVASGAEAVVLDVKCGSGALRRNLPEARELASSLQDIANRCGLRTRIAITDMDQPLGRMVGNALEVREAWEVLRGGDLPATTLRFRELCVDLAGLALAVSERADDLGAGRALAEAALSSGPALQKAREWIHAQGGAPDAVDHPERLPSAAVQLPLMAPTAGWVARVDAEVVGEAVVDLGGGRLHKEDSIDPAVGVELGFGVGSPVQEGDRLATIHAASEASAKTALEKLAVAIQIQGHPTTSGNLVLEIR